MSPKRSVCAGCVRACSSFSWWMALHHHDLGLRKIRWMKRDGIWREREGDEKRWRDEMEQDKKR